mmetsp:Transcript_164553/g.527840  ORF Transcript_164553/g.527840 Transcript_164553/m.527840 type:complete len:232 (-) Transcript_164553:193-888(-)
MSLTAPPGWQAAVKVLTFCRKSHTRSCPSCAPVMRVGAPSPSGTINIEVMCPWWPFKVPLHWTWLVSQSLIKPLRSPLATVLSHQTNSSTGALCPVHEANKRLDLRSQTPNVLSYDDDMANLPCPSTRTREIDPMWPVRSTQLTPLAFQRHSFESAPPETARPSGQWATEVTHSEWPKRFVNRFRVSCPARMLTSFNPWSALPSTAFSPRTDMQSTFLSDTSTTRPEVHLL